MPFSCKCLYGWLWATIAIRSGVCGINNKIFPIIAVTADVMETTKES
jgi:hypothetical protein